ncbi:hypothetical protein CHARACLAT_022170 [Characodon lateralis]|uniref:Uncharacterized protein n=1 Tax=Characodon lateralis TaxID=208331 RepID=A0ABU7F522_9TELE|nr:hypothetical protein [Characodon lateralis]
MQTTASPRFPPLRPFFLSVSPRNSPVWRRRYSDTDLEGKQHSCRNAFLLRITVYPSSHGYFQKNNATCPEDQISQTTMHCIPVASKVNRS